ncbi:MAG: hypothetical protein LUF78_08645 [Clostridiales bacterium]|nr:hypothetical protein [Clostridiales bacterium]
MILLDIYGGLLGCGKTTLIKQMLRTAYTGHRIVIIENEIGKVNLDMEEFAGESLEVRELTSGCVCCTIRGNFRQAVEKIAAEQKPEYILLEPSGAADLSSLIRTCTQVPGVALNRFIMVADARKVKVLLTVVGDFYKCQIMSADTVYLNFADTMNATELKEVKTLLRKINPELRFVDTGLKEISSSTFTDVKFHDGKANTIASVGLDVREAGSFRPMRIPSDNRRSICTWTYVFSHPFSEEKWAKLRDLLERPQNSKLWRIKGLLPMENGYLKKIDQSFGDFYEEARENYGQESAGTLVLIGEKIDTGWFLKQFTQLETGEHKTDVQ